MEWLYILIGTDKRIYNIVDNDEIRARRITKEIERDLPGIAIYVYEFNKANVIKQRRKSYETTI